MTITYRPAAPADGPALDTMAREIWLATFGHSAPAADIAQYVAEAYGPEGRLIRDLHDPAITFQIACDGDAIVGYAKLGVPFVDPALAADALQLLQLYIAAIHHGTGIADTLMHWAMDEARAHGAAAMVLTVWEENMRARRFYDRYGFVHVGDYAFQTGTQIDRDLVLRRSL